MIPAVWIYWAVSLTIVTYASAYIVKNHREHGFAALTAFYVIYLGASQVLATRVIDFNLGFYSFFAPAAVFIYPFIAQAIDMVNEVYGVRKTQLAILIAFITQVLLVFFIIMTNTLTPAPFFAHEAAWQSIFGLSIRVTFASWIAFLINQNIDAWVFDRLKKRYPKQLVLRSITSDIADLTLDSLIFVPLAFYGTGMPVIPLIIGQIISKNIIGLLDTPWFIWYKKMIG
jgi:uncharacterized integral membrane protein (TIGR00697 family)